MRENRADLRPRSPGGPSPVLGRCPDALHDREEGTRLLNLNVIPATDHAAAFDYRVDTDADLVVLGRRAQDARIPWQVPLGQGRHDTADAGPDDAQANRVSDGERAANPSILDEVLLSRGRRYHDVGTKARDLARYFSFSSSNE